MEGDVSTTAGRSAHPSAFRLVCKALSGRHGHPRPSRNLLPQSSIALLTHCSALAVRCYIPTNYETPRGASTRQPWASIRELRAEAATTQMLYCTLRQNGRGAQLFLLHAVHVSRLGMILPTGWGLSQMLCFVKTSKHEAESFFCRFVKWRLWE